MATRLAKLNIDEVSGVESPANELPGFLVIKSEDDARELLKDVDRMESDFAIAYSSLQALTQYLGDAPPEIGEAIQQVSGYIESVFGEEDGEPDPEEVAAADELVMASADKPRKGLLSKLLKREPGEVAPTPTKTEETPTVKTEKAEPAKPKAEPTAKSEDSDVLKSIAASLEAITPAVQETAETTEALKTSLDAALDRIGALEARSTGLSVEETASVTTKDKADRGTAALRASLVQAARQSGAQITLG